MPDSDARKLTAVPLSATGMSVCGVFARLAVSTGSLGLSVKAASAPPAAKSDVTACPSSGVLTATTPPVPPQVDETATGMNCSTLYVLSVCSCGAPAGHPVLDARKLSGTTALLDELTGGPLPTELPWNGSSVTTRAQGSAPLSQ